MIRDKAFVAGLALIVTACSRSQPDVQQEGSETTASPVLSPARIEAAPANPKVYKISDIQWEYAEDAVPYKAKVVAGINRILRENKRCADVDTLSLYRAEGFSRKKPIFYIKCEPVGGGSPFGVTFNINDVDNGAGFGAAPIINQTVARAECEKAIEGDAHDLRDISFSPFFNGNFIPHDDGRATITMAFTGKSSVGTKADYKAICFFKGLTMTEHNIKSG